MSQVETFINTVIIGTVAPLSSTFLTTPGLEIKTGSSIVGLG
jgi:hypothetical protein